jgi:NAD+ diphosphatase
MSKMKDIFFGSSKHLVRYGYLRRDVKHMESLRSKLDESKLIIFNSNSPSSTRLEVLLHNGKLGILKLRDNELFKNAVNNWLNYNVMMQSFVDQKSVPLKNADVENKMSALKLFWLGFDDNSALGDAGVPVYSIDIAGSESMREYVNGMVGNENSGYTYSVGMRDVMKLNNDEASAYSYGKIFVEFLGKHRFCASCGGHVVPVELGSRLYCLNDGDESSQSQCQVNLRPNNLQYPRTDPVVIISLYDTTKGRILLGCNREKHPAVDAVEKDSVTGVERKVRRTMFSCFAGFMEPGETIENACIREVHEETGLRLQREDITIIESQPWPFPSNLMVGCIGILRGDQLTDSNIDIHLDDELDDAQWFDVEEVDKVVRGEKFGLLQGNETDQWHTPPMESVAGRLITRCVNKCQSAEVGKL